MKARLKLMRGAEILSNFRFMLTSSMPLIEVPDCSKTFVESDTFNNCSVHTYRLGTVAARQ